jgi:hypothetical protein
MSAIAVGSAMPDLRLCGPDEAEVALASLWNARPTVLVFLRHFG